MKISKQVAIKFLDAFDEADKDGKLLKVAGGVAQILLLDSFMKSLSPADEDGVEEVEVREIDYIRFEKALKEYKSSKGETF
jgi:hypothetical protein